MPRLLERPHGDQHSLEITLAWATILAAVLDSVLTYVGVRRLGTFEGSPAVAGLIHLLGLGPGLAVRAIVAWALLGALWLGLSDPRLRVAALAALAIVNVAVIGWNLQIMWG